MEFIKELVEYGMIGLLILMSMAAVAITIEKYLVLRKVNLKDYKDKKSLELELTKKMHFLATIGSNAPYVGLLGTVLGIMLTFYTMGKEGVMDSNKIMVGLALAMKVTAVGLGVAIPTVVFYNLLLRKIKELIMKWEIDKDSLGEN
ncbi:MAG: TonB-system energizer ExbB [Spirochaetia bacterium]|nr:TonB-system energizer ExbB [Spirochaetia bacterium]